jgi:hypothetical protein
MGKLTLSRRSVLRGMVGGAIGSLVLPPLDAMFNHHGDAHADATPLPKRFGVWWWGIGVRLNRWIPSATGKPYPASEELQPFFDAGVQDYVSVASGMNNPFPDILCHHSGWASMLTGSVETTNDGRPGDGNFIHPSIDQVVAAAWRGQAHLDSAELWVSQRGAASGPGYCTQIAQTGGGQGIDGLYNPRELFNRLFASGLPMDPGQAMRVAAAKKSMLDGFLEDGQTLRARLGTADRAHLDQYLDNLRSIEQQIGMVAPSSCALPSMPGDDPNSDLGHEDLVGRGRLLVDLLVAALSCDITRVFSLEFTPTQAQTIYWQLGATDGYHEITHSGDTEMMHRVVVFNMTEMAYLLSRLKATAEGNGNLLDSACIYATTEHAEGDAHSKNNMPILLAGKAGGSLQGGVHYHSDSGEVHTKVMLTALHAIGLSMSQFGYNEGQTSETVGALLA